ncbi:DUF2188 domain-containing protein [Actinomycetospora sp. TBRC 11914]|uniref:DUF2188 domain-containing protein n=1 Tax=Actinomycetospora sp. TBRC 11914 TaxID=2729387 RepID=UPI00145D0597|nr:DUF2188 domain-containing protein [Actinomycetospora sp. TBRC 11914]NMO89480.1 DUF2188 domain-containing protein [Actinomycetospora sp. TBRC 11914]
MSDRHVKPTDEGWAVTAAADDHVTARTATEVEAVERAVNIVADQGGGQVVVHDAEGQVVETHHVDAGTADISRTAAEIAESAGVEGAVEAVEAVVGDDDEGVTDAAEVLAAEQVGQAPESETVGGADRAHEAVGDTDVPATLENASTALAERTGHTPEAVHAVGGTDDADAVREVGEDVAAGADRLAGVGARIGDEAEDAADDLGRRVHDYTEAAAAPLDHLAHALNPVRVCGRVVGVLVAAGTYLFGVGASRGTAAAQQGAHRVAGR